MSQKHNLYGDLLVSGSFEANALVVNSTLRAQLTNETHLDQVYYDSATGELTYGAAPVVATPTLDLSLIHI